MDKVANSGNDEFYTPRYAIEPIIKYLKPGSRILCPFDTQDSLFVKVLVERGFKVMYSHINSGFDFFNLDESEFELADYIISNPPYSCKGDVLERLFKVGKPFAMLVGIVGLFESQKRFDMFKNNDFEILYMSRRVAYFKDYKDDKPSLNPPFSSVYVCHKILPKQIVFEEIIKK